MVLLTGKQAPEFSANAVVDGKFVEAFSLKDFLGESVLFFFYPLDFTFVCPTELHAFQEALSKFQERKTHVVACSVDSQYAHYAWLRQPKKEGGIEGITYPLVADVNKEIATAYGVLNEEEGIAFRGLFLIDREGIVRHQLINDLPLGRSVEEALRLVDALHFHEIHGEVCPANWRAGEKGMTASNEGLKGYFGA